MKQKISNGDLMILASMYPFPIWEIKEFQKNFNLSISDLTSVIEVSMKCKVSLGAVHTILNGFKENTEVVPADVFYNKELSDAVRDIVKNSACTFNNAVTLMRTSKNYAKDIKVIKELLNIGVKYEIVLRIIVINNAEQNDKSN